MVQNLKSMWSRWERFWSQGDFLKNIWRILRDIGITKTMWCLMTIGLVLCYWIYDPYFVNGGGFFSRVLAKISVFVAIFIWIGITYGIVLRKVRWKKRK